MKTITLPSGIYAVDDQLQKFEIIEKKSSNVAFVGTDIPGRRVYVQFKNGSGYMYNDVDLDTLSFIPVAESVGKFVSSHIVGHFPSQKMEYTFIIPAGIELTHDPFIPSDDANELTGKEPEF